MISEERTAYTHTGVTVLVGTRDARLVPECVRGIGGMVHPGGEELTVFVPAAVGRETLANVAENGRIAACFTRVMDHRSVQIKGRVVAVRETDDSERERIDRYRGQLAQALAFVGLPPRLTVRMAHRPCHAIRFRAESIFVQTPGPGAGEALGAHGGGARG